MPAFHVVTDSDDQTDGASLMFTVPASANIEDPDEIVAEVCMSYRVDNFDISLHVAAHAMPMAPVVEVLPMDPNPPMSPPAPAPAPAPVEVIEPAPMEPMPVPVPAPVASTTPAMPVAPAPVAPPIVARAPVEFTGFADLYEDE